MPPFHIKDGIVEVPGKIVTKLDQFVLECMGIIEAFTEYVIISGYVSIFFGRARGTEDVDAFIQDPGLPAFGKMYDSFESHGFECTADKDRAYIDYLRDQIPICFWRKDFPLLRLEIKLAAKPSQKLQLKDRIKVVFDHNKLWMSSIEAQIAYKRYIAKSDKDIQDSRHLELVFSGLDPQKIKNYKALFEKEL